MAETTISSLRDALWGWRGLGMEYTAKQIHPVPPGPVVDRHQHILGHAAGKVVLDIGASGALHDALLKAAARVYAIDRPAGPRGDGAVAPDVTTLDLDDVSAALPPFPDVQLVVCGEVLEHLSNPGWFLRRLRAACPGAPVIISVPNAFSEAARRAIINGSECVNIDHVSWYSPRTLKTLLEREGYRIGWFGWYNGRPPTAEGLIVVAI